MPALADLLLALTLPLAGGDGSFCPGNHAEYRLNWTANIANEHNAAGAPTMAFAMSKDGPALPVEMRFRDPYGAFSFDRPLVSGVGTGTLALEQTLPFHDARTRTELLFNRHVANLTIRIDGVDESMSYTNPYSDRLEILGANADMNRLIEPFISQDGLTPAQDQARHDLRARLGRDAPFTTGPARNGPFDTESYASLTASFDEPVSYVSVSFGSDGSRFPSSQFTSRPGTQSVSLGTVRFCVPFGSRAGD